MAASEQQHCEHIYLRIQVTRCCILCWTSHYAPGLACHFGLIKCPICAVGVSITAKCYLLAVVFVELYTGSGPFAQMIPMMLSFLCRRNWDGNLLCARTLYLGIHAFSCGFVVEQLVHTVAGTRPGPSSMPYSGATLCSRPVFRIPCCAAQQQGPLPPPARQSVPWT